MKIYNMKIDKTMYLSRENFENKLEKELTIVSYPNKKMKYYICQDIDLNQTIRIYVNK